MSYKPKLPATTEGGLGASTTSPTARKVPVSNGTNFVASSETWATPGTSTNLFKSDGTNWTSAARPAATGIGFTMQLVSQGGSTITTANTWYIVPGNAFQTANAGAATRYYLPKNATLKAIYGQSTYTNGTSGNTTLYVRINNTTNVNITTTLTFTSTPSNFNVTGLSTSLTAGDFIEVKMDTPLYGAPQPQTVNFSLTMYFE